MSDMSANKVYGDRYEIQSKIARGGMADVFLARDNLLDRPVALKVLFPELSVDPSFVQRFRREAQNAAKLSHPNIVSVYDWGEEASTYYIVMEYVDGDSLSSILKREGPMGADRAAKIGAEVAAALSFAHKNGMVHRDVKPGNVLIDGHGSVKVADFGIARARNSTENLTQTGAVMGTATYFSPEQAQGLDVDPRSDVYSLGVVLYEMVTGKAPFQGDNPVAIAYKHVREDPIPLRQVNASIPGDFEAVVAQAMTKAPANRYASAEDLRADLERFSRGQPVTATRIAPAPLPVPSQNRAAAVDAYADSTRMVPPAPQRPYAGLPRDKEPKGLAVPLMVFVSLLALLGIAAVLLFGDAFHRDVTQIQVPDVKGKKIDDAQKVLTDAKLSWTVVKENSDQAENTVISQNPGSGATVPSTQRIALTVSSGPAPSAIPDVTNQPVDTATKALQRLGLTVKTTQVASEIVDKGRVISQDPSAGQSGKKGDQITLTISTGPQEIEVPDVTGFTMATAAQTLSDVGLRSSIPSGTDSTEIVQDTDPPAGSSVPKGTTITLRPERVQTTTSSSSTTSSTSTSSTSTTLKKN